MSLIVLAAIASVEMLNAIAGPLLTRVAPDFVAGYAPRRRRQDLAHRGVGSCRQPHQRRRRRSHRPGHTGRGRCSDRRSPRTRRPLALGIEKGEGALATPSPFKGGMRDCLYQGCTPGPCLTSISRHARPCGLSIGAQAAQAALSARNYQLHCIDR